MIRVLLVDDHRLFRAGLSRMLAEVPSITLVGEADTGEGAVNLARELRPNVVLMDLFMPGIGGLEACRRIVALKLDIKVLMVSGCTEAPFPAQALRAGATGYVSKSIPPDELLAAIKKTFVAKRYLSREIADQLALRSFENSPECPFDLLSGRELQIMLMVVNCQKVGEISSDLHLSPKTVNSYRYRIFEKLNVSSDVELALMAVRHGMITTGGQPRLLPA
ncbi:MAG: response regulator [Pseudomonadota bacterium]